AYAGCYALSKVLEEVMLEQYGIQHDLNVSCLRAPWIMEKDDLRYHLSFGEDVFGAPRWRELVGERKADAYVESGTVPVMLDEHGRSVKRNFVHVEDLVDAILAALDNPAAHRQTFNVSMDEPIDYGALGAYLAETRGVPSVGVRTEFHSTWLDNAKARFLLGWRPRYDLKRLVDEAWSYSRGRDEPRTVWDPGAAWFSTGDGAPRPMRRSASTLSGERRVSSVVLAPVAAAGWVVLALTDLVVRIALFRAQRTQGMVSLLWALGFGLFLW